MEWDSLENMSTSLYSVTPPKIQTAPTCQCLNCASKDMKIHQLEYEIDQLKERIYKLHKAIMEKLEGEPT
jgi:hypothetical protein